MVTLVEETALLAFRDDTGRNAVQHLELGLAGAVLLELTLARRIDIDDGGRVVVLDAAPTGHPVTDTCLARISGDKPRKAKAWVQKLSRGLKNQVLHTLVDQRVLTHQRDSVLGFIPFNRYRPADARVEAEIRTRLDQAVTMSVGVDERTSALAGIVYAANMEKAAFPDRKRRETRKILKTLSESSWAATATKKAIAAAQAAVTAAVASSASSGGDGGGGGN